MPASRVESQFATLERPVAGALTLTVDGARSLASMAGGFYAGRVR